MTKATDITMCILMVASLLVLMLETIGNTPSKNNAFERPHIRLLVIGTLIFSFMLIFVDLYQNNQNSRLPFSFTNDIASIFLIINTAIALFIGAKGQTKHKATEIYFLLLAMLALSICNVCSTFIILKMITSIAWLVAMTALVIRSTKGGKKAEIGLKMSFVIMIIFLQFLFAIFLLSISHYTLDLKNLILPNQENLNFSFLAIMLLALAGISLVGTPPFHFGHVDCADGGNITTAFLFLAIQPFKDALS